MDDYKNRIQKSLNSIDNAFSSWQKDKELMQIRINKLESENIELKKTTNSVIAELDNYIIEMEKIRQNHGSSNNRNK